MAAATVALGTYIGSGTDPDGAEVSYTLRLMEKKLAWLDYKAEKPRQDKISWHSEGYFVFDAAEEGKPLVRFTIGGLPGQARVGEVYEFVGEPLPGGSSHVLRRDGIRLQPQADTLQESAGAKVCAACGKTLVPGKQFLKLGDKFYHKECLVCKTCGAQLTGQFQTQEDGSRLCMQCVPRKFCEACKKAIHGPATSIGGKMYHPECFACEECHEPLSGSVYNKRGKRLCKACVDGATPKARAKAKASSSPAEASPSEAAPLEAPKPQETAAPKSESAPTRKADAVAPPPEVATPKVKLKTGCYNGKDPGENGSEVAYSLRIMDDCICWLEKRVTTKISNSCWHAEGAFVEELDPWCIRFTVQRCPYGGGPSKGSIYELKVETEGDHEVIICEGIRCLFQADVPDIAPFEYLAAVNPAVKDPPKPVPKPAVTAESAKLPAEGAPTRLVQGSAGVMERKEIDKSNSVIKGEAPKVAVCSAGPPSAAAAPTTVSADATPPAAGGFLSLEELKNPDIWKAKGVDATKREEYLSDDDFTALFGMSKADFAKMPKWKRDGRKRENGLF